MRPKDILIGAICTMIAITFIAVVTSVVREFYSIPDEPKTTANTYVMVQKDWYEMIEARVYTLERHDMGLQ